MGTTMYTPLWPAGYQSITATSGAAVGFTITASSAASATRPEPNFAYIVCQAVSARWRDDGTDPAALTGVPLPANTLFQYDGNLRAIKFFTDAGAQTIIHASLYRAGP
jgi:hypothetical protein